MCFSAAASFASAALLLPLGITAVVHTVRSRRPDLLPLALMPVGFGLQQALEGVVWLGLRVPGLEPYVRVAAQAYLFFALAFWPSWIPFMALSLWPPEQRLALRPLLWLLQGVGLVLGIGLWLPLLVEPARLDPSVMKGSIDYGLNLLLNGGVAESIRYLYAAVICLPLLLLPSKGWRAFGVALLLGGIGADWFYRYAFVSVWCYFSALLSLLIVWRVCRSNSLLLSPPPASS